MVAGARMWSSSRPRCLIDQGSPQTPRWGPVVVSQPTVVIPLRGPVIMLRPYVVRAAAGSSNLPPSTWSRCFSRALCPGEYYLQPFFTRACWRGFGTALTRPGISRYGTIVTAAFAARVLSKYVGVLSALRRQLRSSASGRRPLRPPRGGARSPSSLALRLQFRQPPLRELLWGVSCWRLASAVSSRSLENWTAALPASPTGTAGGVVAIRGCS